MPKINVLPRSLAELIAAGEVVERPASVMKELVENSIDAGATSITAEIKNGGITYLRVTDNGCGIEKEDIRNAFKSHATSKIAKETDLDSIMTLGFRGEALASVAAVARVELLTRPAGQTLGTRYCIEAGDETVFDDAGCPAGTTIIVRDLFFSTPARMKFLKKDVSESNAVAGVMDRLALSHPEVAFRFIRDGKQALVTGGTGELLTAAREVFGKEFASALIPASGETEGIKVSGYISVPHAARPNRNMQFFFINGRLVKTGTGSAALSEAYKNSVMVGKFPSCILNLELSPLAVDVNVHPAKTEVRFSNEKSVFNAVYFACKGALAGDVSRAQYKAKKPVDFYAAIEKPPEQIKLSENKNFWQRAGADEFSSADAAEKPLPAFKADNKKPAFAPAVPAAEKKYESIKDNPPAFVPKKEAPVFTPASEGEKVVLSSPQSEGYNPEEDNSDFLIPDFGSTKPKPDIKEEPTVPARPERDNPHAAVPEAQPLTDSAGKEPEEEIKVIGEAFCTYIIVESGGKLLIIDKHAAHERMIYERLKSSCTERTAQLLLCPVTVTLTKEEYSAVLSNLELLREGGFEVEDFGQGMVIVRECPMELDPDEVSEVICELAGKFADKRQDTDFKKLDHIFHSVACRSAIKAGDFTSKTEMERFVRQLLSMPQIRYCPHGRPVLIEMTQRELEKNFGRV